LSIGQLNSSIGDLKVAVAELKVTVHKMATRRAHDASDSSVLPSAPDRRDALLGLLLAWLT
jgi:hypothetical protein